MTSTALARSLVAEIQQHPERYEGNLREAERILCAVLHDDPRNVVALTCLGAVLSDLGKHREAAEPLRNALREGSTDRNTFFNLGVAILNFGDHGEAMGYLTQARQYEASDETWEAYFDPQAH